MCTLLAPCLPNLRFSLIFALLPLYLFMTPTLFYSEKQDYWQHFRTEINTLRSAFSTLQISLRFMTPHFRVFLDMIYTFPGQNYQANLDLALFWKLSNPRLVLVDEYSEYSWNDQWKVHQIQYTNSWKNSATTWDLQKDALLRYFTAYGPLLGGLIHATKRNLALRDPQLAKYLPVSFLRGKVTHFEGWKIRAFRRKRGKLLVNSEKMALWGHFGVNGQSSMRKDPLQANVQLDFIREPTSLSNTDTPKDRLVALLQIFHRLR